MITYRSSLLLLLSLLASTASAAPKPDPDAGKKARQFFALYVKLESNFRPALANLYSDKAVIQTIRHYPKRRMRVFTKSGPEFKPLLRKYLPKAKARRDRNRYTKVEYTEEGNKVRIRANRYSLLKHYTSRITWLVGPDPSQPFSAWRIFEEISEIRP